jgi:medium-chain acyl-[acyl-carrier-protein] hydrolase
MPDNTRNTAQSNGKRLVLALPYGGGGRHAYRSWTPYLGPKWDVITPCLPGREVNYRQTPLTSIQDLCRWLANDLRDHAEDIVAVFGHSMGALLAFELVRSLRRSTGWQPPCLIVSGHGAPHTTGDTGQPLHTLPSPLLLNRLRSLSGLAQPFDHNLSELWELIEPTMRADLQAAETYRFQPAEPLDCPLLALGGTSDPGVTESRLAAWQEHTNGPFAIRRFPGNHFYFEANPQEFVAELRLQLTAVTRPGAAGVDAP